MLKHTVKLEHRIGDKEGHFICDNDTPLPVAREMLCQFLKHLGYIEDQVMAQQQAQAEQQAKEQANEKTDDQSAAA